jgi:hypothetical protein
MSLLPEQSGVKEAYILAYAAFRLAANLDNLAFRQSFEKRGLELLSAALEGDAARQEKLVQDMEYLVGFGRDVGSIHPQTAELILSEISKFNPAAIAGTEKPGFRTADPVPAKELFPNISVKAPQTNVAALKMQAAPAGIAFERTAPAPFDLSVRLPDVPSQSYNARKDRIVERIRQSGNLNSSAIGCRLRDIQEVLPDLSERTLRYDLQRLVAEGIIERIGNGGPATFYKIRQ